ncbi:hypothetical protein [Clostridium thermobutyricum]|uniref:hypothetical protein n=1 Tax=Clostridium thermobutyricum TaxID=29372 RepID=UPI0029425A22|nr:hypothetical protein [Clostridium thermobutyricum]
MTKTNAILDDSTNIIRNQQRRVLDAQIIVQKLADVSDITLRNFFNVASLADSLKDENEKLKAENEKLKGCVFCGTDKDITSFKNKIVCKKCIKELK